MSDSRAALPSRATRAPREDSGLRLGDWQSSIDSFLADYQRESTRMAYRRALDRFATWARSSAMASPGELDVAAIRAYGENLSAWGVGARTLRLHRTVLTLFLDWWRDHLPEGRRLPSRRRILALLPRPEVARDPPAAPSEATVRRLLAAAARRGSRELLVVQMSLFCGLRTSEVAAARLGSGAAVSPETVAVRLLRRFAEPVGEEEAWLFEIEKAGVRRQVPIPEPVRRTLIVYLHETGRLDRLGTAEPLLLGRRSARGAGAETLDTSTIYRILARLATEAGIEGKVSPSRLRHRCGLDLARIGSDPGTLARILGHRSMASARAYFAEARFADARRALDSLADRWAVPSHPTP